MWPRLETIVWLVALGSAATAPAAEPARPTIEEIVANVRANEELYDNLDVTFTRGYVHHQIAAARAKAGDDPGEPEDGEVIFTERQATRTHCVLQDGMFRGEREGELSADGGSYTLERIRAFDGSTTRLYDQGAIGNIIQGRSEDEMVVRPHMFLLVFMNYFVPLSTYLSGHEAMHAYPGCILPPEYTIEVTYQGEAEFNGLKCHRVWITTSTPDFDPHDRWELWLAEDRNYIPARNLGYTLRYSETDPVGEGRVEDWEEVEPGIWFPMRVETTSYDRFKSLAPAEREPQWTLQHAVETVSLNPTCDVEYFRDVPFPDGTAVYELADGSITDSYTQGAPEKPGGPTQAGAMSRWWLLWFNLCAATLVAGLYYWRRRLALARNNSAADATLPQ